MTCIKERQMLTYSIQKKDAQKVFNKCINIMQDRSIAFWRIWLEIFIFKSLILITDFGVLANKIKFSLKIARGVLRGKI